MPGVIDVHTDYLEKEISPRPGPRDGYADVIATRVDGESRFAVSDAAGLAVFAR
jgi:alpha-D-ribose 1-methylphosphonate 5-triphosphate diphosphatase PhnM